MSKPEQKTTQAELFLRSANTDHRGLHSVGYMTVTIDLKNVKGKPN